MTTALDAGPSGSAGSWWRGGVIYQIYPRSFQDADGDGVGDLAGIAQRLDHLVDLGVDALWISPFFTSPMADFGYDVADYCDVDPLFGSLAAFDRMMAAAKARGLRVILDLVPNHTSDRHPWFLASKSSRDDPRRDWYLWRDPAPDGGPPNNWLSDFGGSAWTLDPGTGQYYAHMFLKEQPDLNWRNPEVRRAIYDAMRFWLRRGVDGFRVDVIYHLIKDARFRDNPPNPDFVPGGDPAHRLLPLYTSDRPEVQQIVAEMRGVVDEFERDAVLIGEVYLPIDRLVRYYGADADGALRGAQLPFNFHLIGAGWQAAALDALVRDYEAALPPGAAPNWVLGNHDKPRIASRVGPGGARLAAMLLLTLRGTPTLYYGDELGMPDVPIAPSQVQDPFERRAPGLGLGRDPQRTPMPWSAAEPAAGFTTGRPWLPLWPYWRVRGVQAQGLDPVSMLQLYRRLLSLRRRHASLNAGRWTSLGVHDDVWAYGREAGSERLLVLLNFARARRTLSLPSWLAAGAGGVVRILLSTALDRDERVHETVSLRPEEGLVVGLG